MNSLYYIDQRYSDKKEPLWTNTRDTICHLDSRKSKLVFKPNLVFEINIGIICNVKKEKRVSFQETSLNSNIIMTFRNAGILKELHYDTMNK